MPRRFCQDCGRLFDRATSPGHQRCAPCQQHADQQHEARRGTTTQRGYGAAHQAERARQLEAFTPGQPCARCGRPIASADDADLGHTDDRSGYRGLEHAACNRGASRKSRQPGRQPVRDSAACDLRPDGGEADDDQGDDDWIGIA